jgi:hypothetical protein
MFFESDRYADVVAVVQQYAGRRGLTFCAAASEVMDRCAPLQSLAMSQR